MTEQEYKVLENRLRRAAERQSLRLEKSRARDPRAVEYGTYQLVDPSTNTLVSRGLQSGYGLTLDEVAQHLRMGSERDEIDAESQRFRYTIARTTSTQTSSYEKPTRRVVVRFDKQFRDVVGVEVEQTDERYEGTLEGALAALRGRR